MQASLNTLLATTALYVYDAVTISDKKGMINRSLKHGVTCKQQQNFGQ